MACLVSFLLKRKNEQLVLGLNLSPCPSPKPPGEGPGALSLCPGLAPSLTSSGR